MYRDSFHSPCLPLAGLPWAHDIPFELWCAWVDQFGSTNVSFFRHPQRKLICYKERRPAVQFRNTHSAKLSQAPIPQWAFTSNHYEQKLKNESNYLEKKIQLNRISKVWFFFFVWSSLSTSLALPFKMHNHLRLCCHSLHRLLKSLWRTLLLELLIERRIAFAWQRASQHALSLLVLP